MIDSALRAPAPPNGGDGPPATNPSNTVPIPQGSSAEISRAAPSDKRSAQGHAIKSVETSGAKWSAFGIFGKFKEEDDSRDHAKRLKAENKRLREQLRILEVKSNQLDADNERFKSSLAGERRINNQLRPDSFYASALERLSVGITDWTVTHFRGKNTREYTNEMIDEIRCGLKKLSEANNLIPPSLHWVDVDLQTALTDSKFRIAFVQHVIGLHFHEKIFSPFSYEIEDFGLGYWLKRISDEVMRSGDDMDVHFKWDWSKTLFKTIPDMFDGSAVEARIVRRIKRILRPIHPRETPVDMIFEKLQEYIHNAIEIGATMRLEQSRFVSTFPIQAAAFQPSRHSTGGEDQTGAVRMCIFPGIIKQGMFLGASTSTDISIFKARVHLESTFAHIKLEPLVPKEKPTPGKPSKGPSAVQY